jgi:hypothetical protein
MIQRIQTLLLWIVAALHFVMYYVPYWGAEHEGLGEVMTLQVGDVVTKGSSASAADSLRTWVLGLAVLNGLILLGSIVTVFIYKNRMLQLRITRIMLFLEVIFIMVMFYSVEVAKKGLPPTDEAEYELGAILPIACIVLIFLAGQRILHDELLVRSADRLR